MNQLGYSQKQVGNWIREYRRGILVLYRYTNAPLTHFLSKVLRFVQQAWSKEIKEGYFHLTQLPWPITKEVLSLQPLAGMNWKCGTLIRLRQSFNMLGSAKMLQFDKAFKGALSRHFTWAVQLNSMREYDNRGFVNRAQPHLLAKRKASVLHVELCNYDTLITTSCAMTLLSLTITLTISIFWPMK